MRPITFRTQITMNALTVLIVVLLLLSSNTFASPGMSTLGQTANTTTISYQGRLTNTSGQPLNATVPMVFRLYAAPTGGTALWTESRNAANAVPVASGLFNVLLGSVTPISLNLLSRDLWLGISVNGDAEMTPREKLGTVPYAARAGTVVDGSITTAKLANGAVGPAKLSSGAVDRNAFASMTGIVWKAPPAFFLEDLQAWTTTEQPIWDISTYLQQAGVPNDAEMILLGWQPSLISDLSIFELLDSNDQVIGALKLGTKLPDLVWSPAGIEYGSPIPIPGATRKIRYAAVGGYTQAPTSHPRRSLIVYGWK